MLGGLGDNLGGVAQRLGTRPKPVLNRAGFFGKVIEPSDLKREQFARDHLRMPWERIPYDGYRPNSLRKAVFEQGADLRGADLREFKLQDAWAQGVDLSRAKVEGATLGTTSSGINLREAILDNVDFSRAEISGEINLTKASLKNAKMLAQDLSKVQASEADFSQATIHRLDLQGANLQGATFDGAKMAGVVVNDANIWGASFRGADLTDARLRSIGSGGNNDFSGAMIEGLELDGSSLPGSQFDGAKGSSVYASSTNLTGGNFRELQTTGSSFNHAKLSNSNWDASKVGRSEFDNIDGKRASFRGASFTGNSFDGADLRGSQWNGADVRGTSFSGANFQTAPFEPNRAWAFGKDLPEQKTRMPDLRRASSVKGATATGGNGEAVPIKSFASLDSQKKLIGKVEERWSKLFTQERERSGPRSVTNLYDRVSNARDVYRAELYGKILMEAPAAQRSEMLRRLEQRIPEDVQRFNRKLEDLLPYDQLQILNRIK